MDKILNIITLAVSAGVLITPVLLTVLKTVSSSVKNRHVVSIKRRGSSSAVTITTKGSPEDANKLFDFLEHPMRG